MTRQTPRPKGRIAKVSRRPKHAGRDPTVGFTRTFRTGVGLTLNNSDFDDTFGTRNLILNPNGFSGFTTVASTFDHYRVRKVRVYLHNRWPTAATANSGQQPRESSVTTTLWTVVDHSLLTTDPVSTPQSIQNYQNARSHVFPANTQVKVAEFTPRITATPGANVIRTQSTWVPTASSTTWSGLRVLARNAGGVILFPSPALQQQCYLYFSVEVEFRQPKIADTSSLLRFSTEESPFVEEQAAESDCPSDDRAASAARTEVISDVMEY